MGFTRRQFIVSSVRAGAGIILPSYYEKVFSYFENHGEPMLEAPSRVRDDLYADVDADYQLNLGPPVYDLPEMTWREVIDRYYDWPGYWEELKDVYGMTDADLDKPADEDDYMDSWCRLDSPNAEAFHLLNRLDIGTELRDGNKVGGLEFYDGPMLGSDYLGVHAECGVSLSLLQHRLNELKTGIKVIPC